MTTIDEFRQWALMWRGIVDGEQCPECDGSGIKTYSDTSTYHYGSVAGQALTTAVCDKCWGSGNRHKPWPSHRLLEKIIK